MIRALFSLLTGFIITLILMPFIIKLSKKLKVRQTILHYVDNHAAKSGTPTMGGSGFLIAALIASLIFMRGSKSLLLLTLAVMLGYGIIGFLDDFIKIFFKRNKGLSPWQKIIFQVLIALIVAFFAYYNSHIGSVIFAPFKWILLDFKFFAVPFFVVVFLAFTNAVNLTDGLDGLASSVSVIYLVFFAVMLALVDYFSGGGAYSEENINLLVFCGALVGGLLGFICFNGYPAKIFMGDTGALAIGGALACLAVTTRLSLNIFLIGIMYILTCASVILQVGYFKLTKKRIFVMAPLHHHYERKGVFETKIVAIYSVITFVMGIATIALIMLAN